MHHRRKVKINKTRKNKNWNVAPNRAAGGALGWGSGVIQQGRVVYPAVWGSMAQSCFRTFPGVKHRAIFVHAGPLRVSHGSVGFSTVGSFVLLAENPGAESRCRKKLSSSSGLWRGWGRTHGKYQVFLLIYSSHRFLWKFSRLLRFSSSRVGGSVGQARLLDLLPFSKGPPVSLV